MGEQKNQNGQEQDINQLPEDKSLGRTNVEE